MIRSQRGWTESPQILAHKLRLEEELTSYFRVLEKYYLDPKQVSIEEFCLSKRVRQLGLMKLHCSSFKISEITYMFRHIAQILHKELPFSHPDLSDPERADLMRAMIYAIETMQRKILTPRLNRDESDR